LIFTAVEGGTTDPSLSREVERYLVQTQESPTDEPGLKAYWSDGPVFEDPDERFKLRVRARLLLDFFGTQSDDYTSPVTDDGAFVRQLRLGVLGNLYTNVIYMAEIEFSNGTPRLRDVFMGLKNLPVLGRLKIGNMREPYSLDATTPIPFHAFQERGASTRAFGLGRNTGIRAHDELAERRLTWWLGLFRDNDGSGAALGDDTGYGLTAKITGLVVRDQFADHMLHLGFSFSLRRPTDDMSRFRARAGPSTGPRLVDTGDFAADFEERYAFAVAYQVRSLTLQAEGFVVRASGLGTDATFWGAYVLVSYWLTGEVTPYRKRDAVWGRVRPLHPVTEEGGGGAWLLGLRYDRIDLTDDVIDGGEMDSITFGVTWMWTPNTRVKLDAVYADVTGGPWGTGSIVYLWARLQFDM